MLPSKRKYAVSFTAAIFSPPSPFHPLNFKIASWHSDWLLVAPLRPHCHFVGKTQKIYYRMVPDSLRVHQQQADFFCQNEQDPEVRHCCEVLQTLFWKHNSMPGIMMRICLYACSWNLKLFPESKAKAL